MNCKCCGQHMNDDDVLCTYCGFLQVKSVDKLEDKLLQKQADRYRAFVISNITDISIEHPLISTKTLRIGDAIDCYQNIVWCREEFPPYIEKEPWCKEFVVHMNLLGEDKTIIIENTMISEKHLWKIGIGIDDSLNMLCFFGNEDFHICSCPYDLQL